MMSQSPEGSSRHFSSLLQKQELFGTYVSIARRLFSSFQLRHSFTFIERQGMQVSQSPEGSSRHFSRIEIDPNYCGEHVSIARRLFSSFQQKELASNSNDRRCLNRPKALLVISADYSGDLHAGPLSVSIARRLFSSFQLLRALARLRSENMSQSPEGSSRHFSEKTLGKGGKNFRMSQSPEGSSRHFSRGFARIVGKRSRMSQSPEGSSRHFSLIICREGVDKESCLNRPKALLVISAGL